MGLIRLTYKSSGCLNDQSLDLYCFFRGGVREHINVEKRLEFHSRSTSLLLMKSLNKIEIPICCL